MTTPNGTDTPTLVITPEQLREHWQRHRRVTRRFIEAFPEEQFFAFSVGGIRPFAVLAQEMIGMVVPTLQGLAEGKWAFSKSEPATTRSEVLASWDETTVELDRLWREITPERFQEIHTAFGQWQLAGYGLIFYLIDNEVHHRAQASVYLRAMGIEPPFFYEGL